MTMLEGLSKPMRDALDAIRAGGNTTFKANAGTIKALIDRGLIEVTPVDQPQRWLLSPVGEMVYFADEVMSQYTVEGFTVGQEVQFLHWFTNQLPWRFEWQDATVQRVTNAFVFVKHADGTEQRHLPKRLRRKPMPTLSAVVAEALIEAAALQPTDTSFEPYIPEPRTEGDRIIVTGFCSVCGCQYEESWPNTMNRERWWRWTNMISRCSVCFRNNCYECGKPLPATDEKRDIGYCADCMHKPADTSFEPLAKEPRMVNERLIAVTAFCKACGGQYDDISYFEVDNPWKHQQIVDYCPICLQFTCMWCGKELPPPANDPYCEACYLDEPPMQVHKAEDELPASVCAEFPLLATFLAGGEGAYHALWTWYMQQISIGLIAYESADPLQAKLYERSLRSASSLLHNRFEEEYFGLVVEVGTGRPEVDLLYHKLPISVEATVRDWLYTWGGFDFIAQMSDLRHVAREHAVYVDPIKPTLTAAEYREGQYGHRQRAGVCRVWRVERGIKRLVENVTSDGYVWLHGLGTFPRLKADETFIVETLDPVRINDQVQRIDNGLIGTVVGVSGGDLWVKPENGGEQPRWKRIHVDVIGGDPSNDPTDEWDAAFDEAVQEERAQDAAPPAWTPDILKRARIKTGLHAGVIGQVTDIGANARGETYKVFTDWYNAGDLEDPNTLMLSDDEIASNCAQIRLHLHGGLRVGAVKSVTHVEDQYYRVVFTHFSQYVPDELFERVRFVYDAIRDGDPTTCSIVVDLAHPPFWRVRQSDEAREFQAVLDAAGIALEARFNAQNELLVYHPLEDVLERLCANVRKLAGVLAVDLGFNDNRCLAQVKLQKFLEGVARG